MDEDVPLPREGLVENHGSCLVMDTGRDLFPDDVHLFRHIAASEAQKERKINRKINRLTNYSPKLGLYIRGVVKNYPHYSHIFSLYRSNVCKFRFRLDTTPV